MASRYLNNITINDAYTLPATDGTNGQGIVTDGAGNLSFQDLASATATSALSIILTVKNVSGGSLSPGTLVRVAPTATPPSGNVLEVDVADNSASSTMPAIGIITDTIADQAEGSCVAFGRAAGFSTSGYTEGDPIWVGTNGAFTGTKPTGTALIQRVGQIIKVHATNGSIEIFGAGRSNDVPNIPQDQLWLGNSSGVATPTAHTVENISNVTVASKTNGQALVWDAANNYWKNGNVASSGGGGSTLSIERDVFTATANQTAFVLTSTIQSIANTQVYIDGVYQSKDNYTTSGSTVTFSTGVPAGAIVEINHFISVYSKVHVDTFTGNNSNVDFTASKDVTDENVTQVYIDGVYQSKDNYSTSGTTITFSTAPPNGSAVEVVHFEEVSYSAIASNQFTGTGSQTNFTLTQAIDEDKSFVFIQGVYQEKSTYSISGTTLTFTTAPQNGYSIEVITIGTVSVVNDALYVDTFTGNGSTVDYTLSSAPATVDAVDVYLNGIYQNKSNFSVSGTTLTFSTAPTNGTAIEVKSTGSYIASADVTLTAGTGISITKNSINNFTISNTLVDYTVSYNTPTGQSLTYTTPSTSTGQSGSTYGPITFTVTGGAASTLSGTASISGLPNGLTIDSQSYNNSSPGNILTITLGGVFPSSNSLNTNLTISGLTIATSVAVDYLIIAGGGGGGNYGGGGGAGGLRTSYGSTSGGGASAESTLYLSESTNYTLTVGGGGAGSSSGSVKGTNGVNSTFATQTSIGGGGGGSNGIGYHGGVDGGSGGGASNQNEVGNLGGAGTSGQGYAGGTGGGVQGTNGASSAGGGGAGGAGSNSNTSQGGNGGLGLAVNILNTTNAGTASVGEVSGSDVYYASGGGGFSFSGTRGIATAGGGGNGGDYPSNVGENGTANTGGGSGSGVSGSQNNEGGTGGSGVVILRYPSNYSVTVGAGITQASGSPFTEGTDKVSVFTAGTGNISFS